MFTGRMYFGREILRHDFEPMYVKAGSNNVAERVAAIQVNIPGQRVYEDLADYGKDNPAAYPHVIIEGLESDPAKLHKRPGMLAKGASGIIVQHQKATRGATIGGLTQWRESFTPEMLNDEEPNAKLGQHIRHMPNFLGVGKVHTKLDDQIVNPLAVKLGTNIERLT